MSNMRELCTAEAGRAEVLQGNIAFAAGCVRAGIHAADGYPGTPSTEVIDKGLAQVQDMIKAGWSVNEAVAVGVGIGHGYAGRDCVVTMKVPGLYQAGDLVTSSSLYTAPRGALVLYVAGDFTPSSTQHVVDPRPLYKSCFLPVYEPRSHQELHEAAELAADISRRFNTTVVIQAGGTLCHSEGLVRLMERKTRPLAEVAPLRELNSLPAQARRGYDQVMAERLPALTAMVEASPLNRHIRGEGRVGVITYGSGSMLMEEYRARVDPSLDILSLAFSNPLPMERIRAFCASVSGPVYVIEEGGRFVQDACLAAGLDVKGKACDSTVTEWTPELVAELLGHGRKARAAAARPVSRPPMICAGCPYRLTGEVLRRMKKRGEIEAVFGDIGCNTLLYFMNAVDTGLAMGASESIRTGYVLSRPESAAKCVSLLGDGTECHSGMAATRNAVFRNVPGVKLVLDNEWIAMTGGQPGPASPRNLAGEAHRFNLAEALRGEGAIVFSADAYNLAEIREGIRGALKAAGENKFVTMLIRGCCIRKVPASAYGKRPTVDAQACRRCGQCLICPGIEASDGGFPRWNNLCSGCVSRTPACAQMCPAGAISVAQPQSGEEKSGEAACVAELPSAPEDIICGLPDASSRPERLSLAIRGVGGQGNLFFGRVLARVAFLAGYDRENVLKGETHGMAQMGGPVISTFACGQVYSPVLAPGTADCLIAMEKSEVLRPGFIDLLRPDGAVLLADTRVLPQGMKSAEYPSDEMIARQLADFRVITVNVLDIALGLGDARGRCANVVMLGALSMLAPFSALPEGLWLRALRQVTPGTALWDLNYAAFRAGRKLV
ncbi:MAG TPA: 2-oxoacid:acceptor oxidoreductase family protein [Candidatus Mailhella excrementigallinarum]|nr:2-oxoacid:acceptor oxidoreductase family protein [Candidatus Mailhella excrementigallinarum]